jgi:transposase InsO family protein
VLHGDESITGADVRRIVARVIGRRGAPSHIRSDNGSQFICEALVNWLPGVWAQSIPVAAGSPWKNGNIESFHSRMRDEFLERVEFEDVADAQAKASCSGENITRSLGAVRERTPLSSMAIRFSTIIGLRRYWRSHRMISRKARRTNRFSDRQREATRMNLPGSSPFLSSQVRV